MSRRVDLPVLWYQAGQRSIGHAQVRRMSVECIPEDTPFPRDDQDDPYRLCLTVVPAVMCECRKFLLACRHDRQ